MPTCPRWVVVVLGTGLSWLPPAQRQPPPWYQVQHVRDLTGDGIPDTLVGLAFRTARPDSFHFVVSIRSLGREVFEREWDDVYGAGESGAVPRSQWMESLAHVFDHTFDEVNFVPAARYAREHHAILNPRSCQEEDPRECIAYEMKYQAALTRWNAEGRGLAGLGPGDTLLTRFFHDIHEEPFDTALVNRLWDDIRTHTPTVFLLSYGDESHEDVAWSPLERRFVTLFACC